LENGVFLIFDVVSVASKNNIVQKQLSPAKRCFEIFDSHQIHEVSCRPPSRRPSFFEQQLSFAVAFLHNRSHELSTAVPDITNT
jgi:hypothetical protein